jgi:hypothetical protein
MSVVLLPGRKDLLLRYRRYHLVIVLVASMRFGLAVPLGSH